MNIFIDYTTWSDAFFINSKLLVIFMISVALYYFAYKISRKPKAKNKRESCEGLISPILAEILVDGKIDLKNLIMTTIVELQIKGNIEVINDNCIRLKHKDNLEIHEYILVNTIFEYENIVNLTDINENFTPKSYLISGFLEKVSKICLEIQTRLYKLNIFSTKQTVKLNIISYIAMLIFINLPTILVIAKQPVKEMPFIVATGIITVITSCVYFSRFSGNATAVDVLSYDFSEKGVKLGEKLVIGIVLFLTNNILSDLDYNLIYMFEILIIYFINYITFKLAKNNVLSRDGLIERQKILELKNYLDNYNLIKNDGLENYIEWDEYFAYSVAFGIPNPVTTEIYKRWNNLNVTLRFTKNLI